MFQVRIHGRSGQGVVTAAGLALRQSTFDEVATGLDESSAIKIVSEEI